jgi:predicted dithiol-disulfide oxidoreductase (DUF899 family)
MVAAMKVATRSEWQAARDAPHEREEELTRQRGVPGLLEALSARCGGVR